MKQCTNFATREKYSPFWIGDMMNYEIVYYNVGELELYCVDCGKSVEFNKDSECIKWSGGTVTSDVS